MKTLERSAGVVYHPFRAALFEYAAEFKTDRRNPVDPDSD
jgi:hypothetical protein